MGIYDIKASFEKQAGIMTQLAKGLDSAKGAKDAMVNGVKSMSTPDKVVVGGMTAIVGGAAVVGNARRKKNGATRQKLDAFLNKQAANFSMNNFSYNPADEGLDPRLKAHPKLGINAYEAKKAVGKYKKGRAAGTAGGLTLGGVVGTLAGAGASILSKGKIKMTTAMGAGAGVGSLGGGYVGRKMGGTAGRKDALKYVGKRRFINNVAKKISDEGHKVRIVQK